ncbi:MAG: acyl carrier protein [Deltaproteobacteria bacterium]|jgi:acyl carrier protein|nr:acyl carrier protein [Deltaproteobacteria bacterium]MBW2266115.1 acyl carrier protein [Deltaproteobacteria bacterium]MBW2319023.1 acyl carrier protein [Deltaproteobacteria bacterium]MBW2602335.1 acyl carrier protein [Deltaproteobacteria bacterium]OEU44981.1 MAG: hypothetical protein BBJ60_07340 [Desulfobacterales bacterium S7086C20]
MDILTTIKDHLAEILDIEAEEITLETYLVRDLGVESIDFLELAVAFNSSLGIEIEDDEIFLANLRLYLKEAKEGKSDIVSYLAQKYPSLAKERLKQILQDLDDGPVLKVKDLVSYVSFRCQEG